jgi:tyrosine-protein phosphatase YwqE
VLKSLFKKKKQFEGLLSDVDLHSHLLPGIDDGVDSMEAAIEVIKGFHNLGYRKLITTPHIMHDFYKNSPENILPLLEAVKYEITQAKINIELEAAAEYYLDEHFIDLIDADQPLLSFGDNYVLFELSFVAKPLTLRDAIFKMQTKGYKPILAHVERYLYYHKNIDELIELKHTGVYYQINLLSLSGYYSKAVKQMAQKLISNGMVEFIGSDCHNANQLMSLSDVLKSADMNVLAEVNLLNNSL